MRVFRRFIPLCGLAMVLGGCVTPGTDAFTMGGGGSGGLSAALARGYTLMAEYEGGVRDDSIMAGHFRQKAEAAKAGRAVEPDKVIAGTDDLVKARDVLLRAKIRGSEQGLGTKIAEAQVNFDCWVIRNARRDPSSQFCRERFFSALEGIDIPEVTTVVAGPREMTFAVYFNSNVEVPDDRAFAVIKKAAASFVDQEPWRIHLTGYADEKGGKQNNLMLSMRRALAVRNALAQNGVDLGKIVIEAEGAQTRGAQGDQARRVDIHIVSADEDTQGEGPDITKIAPHYFGEEAEGL